MCALRKHLISSTKAAVPLFALLLCRSSLAGTLQITQLAPDLLVFATGSGNVVASVGPDGAVLIGTPAADSTAQIVAVLNARTTCSTRYVIVFPEDLAHSQGDAGWGRLGAFVAMQEKALEWIGGHAMGPPPPLPNRLLALHVDRTGRASASLTSSPSI